MRVLIVDDEQAFAEPLAQRLELRGIEAAVAGDAETALGMLSRQEWDLVFLDVCLPGMDGVSLLKLLQEHEPRPDVVMLSGATEMSQAVKAMRRGALNWLAKPVSLDAVLEECRKARERAESRRQARRLAEEARLRSLGRIAEGVAHEVNNPLNIIVQAAGLMGDSLDSPEAEALPDIEDLRESLKAIVTQSMRVREITRKLLMAGVGLDPRSAPMDVQALHDEIAGTMAAAICDKSTGKPTQSRVGVQFDVETVQKQLDAAQPGEEFLADAQVQFPPAATEELEQAMFRDVIGTCTTTCAGPWGRRQNIKLASAAINGRIYNPGEEFWYNATVGQRTEARGFQPAAAYSGGKTVTSIGGGICQVSSTLYYSALMADLQIVLRYAHMFDPGYMPVTGCDATVSWGGPDFAFRNSTNYPIKITTSYNDETNQLTITLLGTKTDDHYVEMTNQFLSYSERKTVYQESESVAPGTTEVEQYGHNGYAVQTYRNVYAGDGTLLRSTKEAYSDYDRADKIILVAPGELPQ